MTAQPIERQAYEPGPVGHDPAAVRTALARHADDTTLALYDREIGHAYLAAVETDTIQPLAAVVERWWQIAEAAENPVPRDRRVSREAAIASWEARHGQKLRA